VAHILERNFCFSIEIFNRSHPTASRHTSYRKSFDFKQTKKHLEEIEEVEEYTDDSLEKTIQDLEESIKGKEALIKEIWKALKLEKEELNFLRTQKDAQREREMFDSDNDTLDQSVEASTFKQINGFEDRLVISIDIKVSGYMTYTLDAQLDTGAMNSCAKYGAIPSYYWQPINIAFRAVNKTEIKIQSFAPDFPIIVQGAKVPINLYCFDTGADILLGQDFVNRCLPFTIGSNFVQFTVLGKTISIPSKSSYDTRIGNTKPLPQVEKSAEKLVRIQKIVNNAEKHGLEIIKDIKDKIEKECTSDYPDAFWTREQYFVSFPYKEGYAAKPQKASANHMSPTEAEYCQNEIKELLQRKLIEPSRSPWACPTFYVNKHSEKKRGKPRMVINYRALNQALLPIRFPLPSKELLFAKIGKCNIFSKFDLKSGFWQIGIIPQDRYKTTFVVPHGQYQWRVMPFGLKNAPSEFQKRMDDIFKQLPFVIVYIDDLLVCSLDARSHHSHLKAVFDLLFKHGLVLSKSKLCWAKTKIEYLGLILSRGSVELQDHVLKKLSEFPDEILEQKQLQRFLGCLNYIRQFYENQAKDVRILQKRLKKTLPWNNKMTAAVQIIKQKIQDLPRLHLPDVTLQLILETDASNETAITGS
jgi:hypothetical protein